MIRKFNEDFKKFGDIDSFVLRYFAFDWDDNILHMPTKIHMEQKTDGGWSPIDVSTEEFAKVRKDDNYQLPSADKGDMQESMKLAFSEFRDNGPRGDSAFLEDSISALNESKLAPAWNDFLKCLSEGAIFSIITARGHEPSTIKKAVEYVIDNYLAVTPSTNPGRTLADEMYQNLRKFKFYFDSLSGGEEKELKGPPSSNPLIQEYLSHCDFFGVSSQDFAQRFGEGSAYNPEESKKKAIDYCIQKCLNWAELIEEKLKRPVVVKFGMSDDDPKNSAHIMDYFNEKSGLSRFLNLYFFYTGKDTEVGEKSLKSGEKTSFKTTEVEEEEELRERKILSFSKFCVFETSHQTTGMESSVLPHKMNMTQQLYPSTKDAPTDDFHNRLKNQTKSAIGLYKDSKELPINLGKEEMIEHLRRCGYSMKELLSKEEEELQMMCMETIPKGMK